MLENFEGDPSQVERVRSEVAKWQEKTENFLSSINLESVKQDPDIAVELLGSDNDYFVEGVKLLEKAKKSGDVELKDQIAKTLGAINNKAKEVFNDERYHKYLKGKSWSR